MGLKSTESGYGWFAQILHWIIALSVFVLFYSGISLSIITDNVLKSTYLQLHIGCGLVVFVLMIIRIAWYFTDVTPEPPSKMSSFRLIVFKAIHLFSYLGLLLLSISGIGILFSSGIGLSFADISSDMIARNLPPVAIHNAMFKVLFLIVAGHIAGVLSYQFLKSDVLHRMGISCFKGD